MQYVSLDDGAHCVTMLQLVLFLCLKWTVYKTLHH